jgi:hypothetical protein
VPYGTFEIQVYKVAIPLPKMNTLLCTTNLFSRLQWRRKLFAVLPYVETKKNIFENAENIFKMGDLLQCGLNSLEIKSQDSPR